MEQPLKQRWKEQKTGKRREKGENLVYFLTLCPGDTLPSSIFLTLSLASSNLSLFLLFHLLPWKLSFTSFFSLHPGGLPPFVSFLHFSTFTLVSPLHVPLFIFLASVWHLPIVHVVRFLLPHSGGSFMLQQPHWLLCFPEEPITAQIVLSVQ